MLTWINGLVVSRLANRKVTNFPGKAENGSTWWIPHSSLCRDDIVKCSRGKFWTNYGDNLLFGANFVLQKQPANRIYLLSQTARQMQKTRSIRPVKNVLCDKEETYQAPPSQQDVSNPCSSLRICCFFVAGSFSHLVKMDTFLDVVCLFSFICCLAQNTWKGQSPDFSCSSSSRRIKGSPLLPSTVHLSQLFSPNSPDLLLVKCCVCRQLSHWCRGPSFFQHDGWESHYPCLSTAFHRRASGSMEPRSRWNNDQCWCLSGHWMILKQSQSATMHVADHFCSLDQII